MGSINSNGLRLIFFNYRAIKKMHKIMRYYMKTEHQHTTTIGCFIFLARYMKKDCVLILRLLKIILFIDPFQMCT